MDTHIQLVPMQWAAFSRDVAHDPKRSALQACCANISALRDVILAIQANDGWLTDDMYHDLSEKWEWCRKGHDFDEVKYPIWTTLKSLIQQAGLPWR